MFTASTACVTSDPMKPNPVPAVTAPMPITTQPTGPGQCPRTSSRAYPAWTSGRHG
jgi:hypothetical protein